MENLIHVIKMFAIQIVTCDFYHWGHSQLTTLLPLGPFTIDIDNIYLYVQSVLKEGGQGPHTNF